MTIGKGAHVSFCQQYRWMLERWWRGAPSHPSKTVVWLMLNPSTADAMVDDPTIRRCIHFSNAWGGTGLKVVNLYPFRSSSPKECQAWQRLDDFAVRDALQENLKIIERIGRSGFLRVVGFGAGAWDEDWLEQCVEAFGQGGELHCLGQSKSGAPLHPMARGKSRVPDNCIARPWVRT